MQIILNVSVTVSHFIWKIACCYHGDQLFAKAIGMCVMLMVQF